MNSTVTVAPDATSVANPEPVPTTDPPEKMVTVRLTELTAAPLFVIRVWTSKSSTKSGATWTSLKV